MVCENGKVHAWLAEIRMRLKKQSLHKVKCPLEEEQYAREALVAKSQLRVKVNKIGPRASGLDPHCMRKCPLKRKMSSPIGQRSVCVSCGKEGRTHWSMIIVVTSYSWVIENENGQRARGRGSHSAGEMVLAKEKGC